MFSEFLPQPEGEHVETILPLLRDPDARVRREAVYTLCSLHGMRFDEEVAGLLDDPDGPVRAAAVYYLTQADVGKYVTRFAKLLGGSIDVARPSRDTDTISYSLLAGVPVA